jgi:uncharacterized protein (DUF2132 family)
MNPCENPKDREKLVEILKNENSNYSEETIEKAIEVCCKQNDLDIIECVKKLTKIYHLNDY